MVSIMMNMKRPAVEETVKEHRADELSALFNMLLDQKKKEAGQWEISDIFVGDGNAWE